MTAIGCRNSKKTLLRLAGALAIVVAACPVIAADAGADELAARRQKIANKSEVERDLLNQQHAKFLAMSPSQQDAIRRLHEELEADARVDGSLRAVLRNYQAWLKVLSPWERAEIRAETDPEKRISLIRRIKEQEETELEQPVPARDPPLKSPDGSDPRRRRGGTRLADADFQRIVEIIAKSLELPQDEQNVLAALPPAHRHIRILMKALERQKPGEGQPPRERWPSDDLVNRMIEAISDPRTRERLEDPERSPDQRRWFLRSMLFYASFHEAGDEWKKRRPTDEQMLNYFRDLDPQERDKLMRQRSDGHRQRLVWQYLGEKGDSFTRDLVQLQKSLSPRFGRNDGRPPGAERARRGGPDGDDRDRKRRQPPPERDVPPPPKPNRDAPPAK
ncbi:MAG: hypothetical protein WD648_12385 [Planctomycetaceae bacterium]